MITKNTSEQILIYRLSRRSLLAGIAGFTSLSSLLAACDSTGGNPAGATPTPTGVSASSTSPASSPTPGQSPTTIPASGPIGATLFEYHGHPYGAFAVAWSPDGTLIASGGSDKTVQVWSAPTGETRLVYRGHTDQVNDVRWSPDGKFIAAYGIDDAKKVPTLQIWEVATQRILFSTDLPNSRRSAIVWSPDSSRLAFAGTSGLVETWQIPSGQHPITFPTQGLTAMQEQWLCLDWSHDDRHLAAGGYQGPVQVWDAQTTAATYTSPQNVDVQAIAWAPNRPVIASCEGTIIRLWQAA